MRQVVFTLWSIRLQPGHRQLERRLGHYALSDFLLGIGVQSEHRELEHGERDDHVSGMLPSAVRSLDDVRWCMPQLLGSWRAV